MVDVEEFLEEILSRYVEATNEYYAEYGELVKSRSVKSLLDLEDE